MSRVIPSSKFWISYTRLSFEDSGLGGVGIVDQHRTNVATILGTDEQVLHLSDSGGHRSGRSDKQRPDWRLAVSLLTNNPLCLGIVATFQDRLSRDVGDTAALVKMCENLNKHLILPTEGVDTRRTGWSPEVKMMIHLKASFAQMYAEDIGRKIKKRVDQINGALIPWGKPAFGQVRVGRGINARIVANSDAPAVVRALTIYAAGSSCFKTLTELNTEGVMFRSRSGVPYTHQRDRDLTRLWRRLTAQFVAAPSPRHLLRPLQLDGFNNKPRPHHVHVNLCSFCLLSQPLVAVDAVKHLAAHAPLPDLRVVVVERENEVAHGIVGLDALRDGDASHWVAHFASFARSNTAIRAVARCSALAWMRA